MIVNLDDNYFNEKYLNLPADIKEKAIKILQENLTVEEIKTIKELYDMHGKQNWIFHMSYREIPIKTSTGSDIKKIPVGHFEWGMGIRNLLREHGLTDDLLPDKNWDDYYVTLINETLDLK